ncbi:MAG: hypothetical protein E7538_08320 [Ruminococcaceae bacterium]|nr:hypothetical protein [Oscillospiraceae bacterium]
MKKLLTVLLSMVLVLGTFTACGNSNGGGEIVNNTLSFSDANSVEEMKKLDGEAVNIIGYMSTLSPITGSFMYLMNLPYQSCPFCVPNTTQLSNTMAVYAKDGDSFEFTDRAIKVVGTLEFGDYTDEYGYEYAYRIKDATYTEVDTSEMGEKLQLWQQLASTDVISDVYNMYEYVNFLCFWPTYTAEFESGKDYLYPTDAIYFVETEGAQYNYGYADGYFEDMIATIKEVNATEFGTLIENIKKAQALADKAFAALKNDEYISTAEYSAVFGDGRSQYIMNDNAAYEAEMEAIYTEFAEWLAEWEL